MSKYKLQKFIGGVNKNLEILSYNIGWESMTGKPANVHGCNGKVIL